MEGVQNPELNQQVSKDSSSESYICLEKKSDSKFERSKPLKTIEVSKYLVIRYFTDKSGNPIIDIRRFFKGNPTKRGIRLRLDELEKALKVI